MTRRGRELVAAIDKTERQPGLPPEKPGDPVSHALRTLYINRRSWNGSLLERDPKALRSTRRWRARTIAARVRAIHELQRRITILDGDGVQATRRLARRRGAALLLDPPYTNDATRVTRRLYQFTDVDHAALFEAVARPETQAEFLNTAENGEIIRQLTSRHQLHAERILVKNGSHNVWEELLISKRPLFT